MQGALVPRAAVPGSTTSRLPEGDELRVVACPHPFSSRRIDRIVAAGATLAELFEAVQAKPALRQHARIFIGDVAIVPEYWHLVRPKPGQTITIRVIPQGGGGGGGGGKSPLRTVLTIAVIAASWYVGGAVAEWAGSADGLGWGSLGSKMLGGFAAGATPLVGMLAVSLVEPPAS